MKKTFEADDKNLAEVIEFVKSPVQDELTLEIENKVELAVEEIFVNIAHYAYGENTGTVTITSSLATEPKRLCVEFCDQGIPFDPLAKPDPDITLGAEERKIGGLGIFLTKKFMDKVEYRYENGSNILYFEKNL